MRAMETGAFLRGYVLPPCGRRGSSPIDPRGQLSRDMRLQRIIEGIQGHWTPAIAAQLAAMSQLELMEAAGAEYGTLNRTAPAAAVELFAELDREEHLAPHARAAARTRVLNLAINAVPGVVLYSLAPAWADVTCVALGWLDEGADPNIVGDALARWEHHTNEPIHTYQDRAPMGTQLVMTPPPALAVLRSARLIEEADRRSQGIDPAIAAQLAELIAAGVSDETLDELAEVYGDEVLEMVEAAALDEADERVKNSGVAATRPTNDGPDYHDEVVPDDDSDLAALTTATEAG